LRQLLRQRPRPILGGVFHLGRLPANVRAFADRGAAAVEKPRLVFRGRRDVRPVHAASVSNFVQSGECPPINDFRIIARGPPKLTNDLTNDGLDFRAMYGVGRRRPPSDAPRYAPGRGPPVHFLN
jgi:hypothetical protein